MNFARMQVDDVAEVLAIEQAVFPWPWSRGNFLDSLASGYEAWVVRDAEQVLLGYLLVMMVLDEAHLLNIALRTDAQGQGHGRLLMDKAVSIARGKEALTIFLEVRPSNTRAIDTYQRYGFNQVGLRKNYYPAANNSREDAVIMSLVL
ncbi:MAG: Ribosomal-protein-S18p-alanine acetyltransferase [Pseudomonadota bacterium]|jgi:ribosomal-protein-alanine N-acetyltransferase